MRIVSIIIMAALLAGVTSAQENSASVEGILKELGTHQGEASAPKSVEPTPVNPSPEVPPAAEVQDPEEPSSTSSAVTEEPPPVADIEEIVEPVALEEVDVEALIEDGRDYYVGGEFAKAQAGFEEAIRQDPENIIARMYLRKLLERDHRLAEVGGMEAVSEAWNTDLTLRSYAISADAVEKMGLTDAEGAVDVEVKFPEADFPKGATAVYQPAMEKLFIRNTRDNLLIIEEILEAMDVSKLSSDVEQVEIEAKFVEVSEGTLEELGFEWSEIAGNPVHTGIEGKDVVLPGNQTLFGGALRGGPTGGSMPFSSPDALGAGATGVSGDWTAFRFENTFNDAPDTITLEHRGHNSFDLIISALDQSTGADVLSAPRVVTKSGEEAIIRVGQLHTYPEIYEPSATGGNIVHVKYDDWEERLLGVELAVTPQVDGDQIELGLNPKIQELQGWQNYDVAPADSSYTWYQYRIGLQFNHDPIVARLPIFRVREIETEVTIADGATIGMGGLISEKVEAFEDKVPFMGSLPLVGRLFRNEGERAIKRNLLMFVTAKIVEPTGRINTSRSFE